MRYKKQHSNEMKYYVLTHWKEPNWNAFPKIGSPLGPGGKGPSYFLAVLMSTTKRRRTIDQKMILPDVKFDARSRPVKNAILNEGE